MSEFELGDCCCLQDDVLGGTVRIGVLVRDLERRLGGFPSAALAEPSHQRRLLQGRVQRPSAIERGSVSRCLNRTLATISSASHTACLGRSQATRRAIQQRPNDHRTGRCSGAGQRYLCRSRRHSSRAREQSGRVDRDEPTSAPYRR